MSAAIGEAVNWVIALAGWFILVVVGITAVLIHVWHCMGMQEAAQHGFERGYELAFERAVQLFAVVSDTEGADPEEAAPRAPPGGDGGAVPPVEGDLSP